MRKLLPLLFIFFITACSQSLENEGVDSPPENLINLTQEEYLSIVYENPSELDTIEVKNLVSDFLNSINEKEKSINISTRSISSDFSLNVNSKSYYKEKSSSQELFLEIN